MVMATDITSFSVGAKVRGKHVYRDTRLLVVGSSCYVNQTSKVACSGEQLL